jgi:hypothetical protein
MFFSTFARSIAATWAPAAKIGRLICGENVQAVEPWSKTPDSWVLAVP